ncbi:PAL2-like protein [Mya arenaria]|uniref:PAL2-like protein n=1 Tax=Mya arenaria TaxID=6604 RepID=A0ABY7EBV4_MYAAR|nr:PAL2-like protein [Mya arenaria]
MYSTRKRLLIKTQTKLVMCVQSDAANNTECQCTGSPEQNDATERSRISPTASDDGTERSRISPTAPDNATERSRISPTAPDDGTERHRFGPPAHDSTTKRKRIGPPTPDGTMKLRCVGPSAPDGGWGWSLGDGPIAIDQTRQLMGVCGKLLLAQFQEVVDVNFNFGLSPNLSGCDINLDFGLKGSDIAMASYMSELDHFVNPMSNHVISAETHNQSVNSMALVSARLTAEAVEIVLMMVSDLLCLTAQAVDLRLLRYLAMEEADNLWEQYPGATNLLEKTEWYDFMFLCDERIAAFKEASGMQGTKAAAEMVMYERMRNLYKLACYGEMYASKYMGKRTNTAHLKFVIRKSRMNNLKY